MSPKNSWEVLLHQDVLGAGNLKVDKHQSTRMRSHNPLALFTSRTLSLSQSEASILFENNG